MKNRFKLKLAQLVLCMLMAVSAFAQSTSYSQNTTVTAIPTYPLCSLNVPVSSCWIDLTTVPNLSTFSGGVDGELWGITTTGSIIRHNPVTDGWDTQPALAGATQLAVANSNLVFVLANQNVYELVNGSWSRLITAPPLRQFSVGVDGDLWGIGTVASGCGYQVFHRDQNTGNFSLQTQPLTQLSVQSANKVIGVCSGLTNGLDVLTWTPGAGWTATTGSFTQVSITPDNVIWALGSNTLYHQNINGGYDTITGQPSLIGGGRETLVYGLFAGGRLKYFLAKTVQFTTTISGQSGSYMSTCPPPPTDPHYIGPVWSCPINHTATATLQIQNHTAKSTVVSQVFNSVFNVSASDTLTPVEAYACMNGQTACPQLSISGIVICDIGGTVIFSNVLGFISNYIEEAFTLAKYTGTKTSCTTAPLTGIITCDYSVTPWCTAATTPPDFNVHTITDAEPVFTGTLWDSWATCTRLGSGQPWSCSPNLLNPAVKINWSAPLPFPPAPCTKKP